VKIPEAHVSHRTSNRLRIKIPSQRGDDSYFASLQESLADYADGIETNAVTASVLFRGEGIDQTSIAEQAESDGLFKVQSGALNPPSLPLAVASPIEEFSSQVGRFTRGWVDLPGLAFLLLLGVGLHQIRRGNIGLPPWYTAFWYAFGVYSKSLVEKLIKTEK
jgi:hypothetical protein